MQDPTAGPNWCNGDLVSVEGEHLQQGGEEDLLPPQSIVGRCGGKPKPAVEETADTGSIILHNFLINCVRASVTDEFREQNLCQPVWLGTNRQFY